MIYDAAIIGAGPAGSSCAYHLEKSGLNIIILDKERFPRPKACAGVIPPRIFSEISVPDIIVERPLDGYRIHSPSGVVVESSFPKPGIIVRREKFDEFLLSGLEGEPSQFHVTGIHIEEDHVSIEGNSDLVPSKFVVGAFGASSLLDHLFPGNIQNKSKNSALGCQFELSMDCDIIHERIGNWFEVYYGLPYGYGWISPLKDAVKVGVGGVSEDIRKNGKRVLNEFLESEPIKNKLEGSKRVKFEAHQIPMGGPFENLTSDRTLLCGDAGGFVFPGTGEGIYYAVKSGRCAASVIALALKENRNDAEFLGSKYMEHLKKNGLASLKEVDFINEVLATEEGAERYVKRLKGLSERSS